MSDKKPRWIVINTFLVGRQVALNTVFNNFWFKVEFKGSQEECLNYIKSKLPQA